MRWAFVIPIMVATLIAGRAAACEPVSIYAAASTTDAVKDIAEAFRAETGCTITTVFASSSILAKQIDAGAPASLFLSANEEWMDELQQRGLLAAGTRTDLLANDLVLIMPKGQPLDFSFGEGANLASALKNGRLALGDPEGVPAGIYAKQALVRLGQWDAVSARIVASDDVRTALAWVARGEARAGIVYRTDARISPDVDIAVAIPENSHEPVRYPIAAIEGRVNGTSSEFMAFVTGLSGAGIFARHGFTPLATPVN